MSLQQLIFSENLAFELLILSLNVRVLLLHLIMAFLEALFDAFERLGDGALVLILQCHLLHVASQLHEVSMSFDMSLLLFLVAIDPDLTSVLFCCDLFTLLHDLVKELFALYVILLLECLLRDFKSV